MPSSSEDSPFIPPMPSPYGAQRGVIPSPRSDDQASLPDSEPPYNMRRMPPRGGHPYGGYPGPVHSPPMWTPPGQQWGHPQQGYAHHPHGPTPGHSHHPMYNTPWTGYPPPGYGPPPHPGYGPPPGHVPHPHSAPYPQGPLPHDPRAFGPTPYQAYNPMGGTPYMQPHGYPAAWGPGSVPMGPSPLHSDDMGYGFPERPTDELIRIDKWAVGSHYAPVLTPFQVAILDATLLVNPLLSPGGDNPPPDKAFLNYNVLFPVGTARRSIDPPSRSWSAGRMAPATSPRVTQLRIISREFPWVFEIEASREQHGVTCLDIIQGIYEQLQIIIPRQHIEALSGAKGETHKRKLYATYHHNRSTARDAPGGSLGEGVRRVDWLLNNVMFDGLVNDQKYVQEKLGISGPGWKGLKTKAQKEEEKEKEKETPRDRLQSWPATLVLKLDQRYGDVEADRESVITDVTEPTEESQTA